MTASLWWLALPVVLLPVWWHRQKRRRTHADTLATARFLPSAPPQQMRVWRLDDLPLLLLRCLLLLALTAWLAAVALPWRGDTVFVGKDAPAEWVDEQARQAGMAGAQRMPLPDDVLPWLQANEHAWRKDAKLLVLAAKVALPAQMPQLAHALDMRIPPPATMPAGLAPDRIAPHVTAPAQANSGNGAPRAASPALAGGQPGKVAAPSEFPVALIAPPERKAAWHALFAAFDAAGGGTVRHVVTEFDGAGTPPSVAMIVWDRPAPLPANWHAPLWWLPSIALPAAAGVDQAAVQTLHAGSMALKVANSPQGSLWASDAWPPRAADGARALYETWHALHFLPQTWALAAQALPAQRTSPLAMPDTRPDAWLAYVLAVLFILERWVTHVRRR